MSVFAECIFCLLSKFDASLFINTSSIQSHPLLSRSHLHQPLPSPHPTPVESLALNGCPVCTSEHKSSNRRITDEGTELTIR